MAKRDIIIDYEKKLQSIVTQSLYDYTKPKCLVTFPYPYMNGTLHLGHAYTISKAEFYSRYKKLMGYNTMFPFAFHGTGMPIVACAKKLKEELESPTKEQEQSNILLKMGVKQAELSKFLDPYYWITYFSQRAAKDLVDFGCCADLQRSFTTTDMNYYYDSFIKWQFEKLRQNNRLVFGKKAVIFSPKDNQPCADHDRSIGEGVAPKMYSLLKIRILITESKNIPDGTFLLVTTIKPEAVYGITKILANDSMDYLLFESDNTKYIARPEAMRNLQYQNPQTTYTKLKTINGSELIGITVIYNEQIFRVFNAPIHKATGIGIHVPEEYKGTTNNHEPHTTYYEPEEPVISRSGDVCVVAHTEQWFIDYGEEKWKGRVINYTTNVLDTIIPSVKETLLSGINWLKEWPCSRSYGLGTKLLDSGYVIDSLSDSTIYMAFYTIAHRINQIPKERVNNNLWEYLFRDGPMPPSVDPTLLKELKDEFHYWYPVDLRVSGKDLLKNHLAMALYNHIDIFGEALAPKRYSINGHLQLNKQKMSKHTGNFMTLQDAITTYGADATRIALAEAGSGYEDANFDATNANNAVLKLTAEREWAIKMINMIAEQGPHTTDTIWDQIFNAEMKNCIVTTKRHYEDLDFQKVIVAGFYDLMTARDSYRTKVDNKLITLNTTTITNYLRTHCALIAPICPHYSTYLQEYAASKGINIKDQVQIYKTTTNDVDQKSIWIRDGFKHYTSTCRENHARWKKKHKDASCELTITISTSYADERLQLIDTMRRELTSGSTRKDIITNAIKTATGKEKGTIAKFIDSIFHTVDLYGPQWYDWLSTNPEENLIQEWLPKLVPEINKLTFVVNNKSTGPWDPRIAPQS
jgi:leucyl-tRNA synthetase